MAWEWAIFSEFEFLSELIQVFWTVDCGFVPAVRGAVLSSAPSACRHAGETFTPGCHALMLVLGDVIWVTVITITSRKLNHTFPSEQQAFHRIKTRERTGIKVPDLESSKAVELLSQTECLLIACFLALAVTPHSHRVTFVTSANYNNTLTAISVSSPLMQCFMKPLAAEVCSLLPMNLQSFLVILIRNLPNCFHMKWD